MRCAQKDAETEQCLGYSSGMFLPLFNDVISTAKGKEVANVFAYCQFT
jgi:hypothetical protein